LAITKISALIHTHNHGRTLGRTLETLRSMDEVVIVDHGSTDNTARVAQQYAARVVPATAGKEPGAYADDCSHDWILCLEPNESIAEGLEAAIFEWKQSPCESPACSVVIRSEEGAGWQPLAAEARLANRRRISWQAACPASKKGFPQLTGHLLRFK
jgi:glycosyltransferase involved in cell wall biosynthesis